MSNASEHLGPRDLAALKDRALEAAANGVVIGDATKPGFPIVYVNAGFERITGYSSPEVIGLSCNILRGEGSDPRATADIAGALREGRECRTTILNYRKDGTTFWNEIHLSPVFGDGAEIISYIGIQNDVSDRRRAQERVEYLAFHDVLTGLPNRALVQKVVGRAVDRAHRLGLAVALLFLDLDNFKSVNDSLGHDAGDELLYHVAARLRAVVRDGDLLARQGGDEFLIAIPDIEGDAHLVAERVGDAIRAALGEPFELKGEQVGARASVGVSILGGDAADASELFRNADSAMYRAKRSGGGYRFFSRHGRARGARRTAGGSEVGRQLGEAGLCDELDRIISGRLVRSLFQPIVEIDSGATVAYEALARGPEGSPLERPDRLFALARAAGRTAELDWACRGAALRMAQAASLDPLLGIFINLEPLALAALCPPDIQDVWDGMRDRRVTVEITERALTSRPAELLHQIERFRARGWSVALDDVGADTRSLALMPLLRPDVIKLDLRLVQSHPTTGVAAIVNAVMAERERTGAVVLAEGIETEEHRALARAMGADLAQGWLFGRPAPLPTGARALGTPLDPRRARQPTPGITPFEVVAPQRVVRVADKRLLLSLSMQLEHHALAIGDGAIVLGAFQGARHFTKLTGRRYTALATDAAFVAALGVGLRHAPAPGVRGANLRDDDPLRGEWSVIVLGPHFAAALVAVDLGDEGPEPTRRFRYALSYDRDLVIAAAASLIARVAPLER
ncbi:MAG: hypothetical protein NVSMB25_13450 [Thermoleophilaceae bacterium]